MVERGREPDVNPVPGSDPDPDPGSDRHPDAISINLTGTNHIGFTDDRTDLLSATDLFANFGPNADIPAHSGT